MSSIMPPQEEWSNRLIRLQRSLVQTGLRGCIVSQNVGIYYLAGSMQTGYLFVPAEGIPTYYVRRSLNRAIAEAQVRTVQLEAFRQFGSQLERDYPQVFSSIRGSENPIIGADLDVMPAQIYNRLIEVVPQARWTDASALLRSLRSVKSEYEIACINKAAQVVESALEKGLSSLQAGMTELEFIAGIEYSMRLEGHIGLMRMRGYNQEIMTGVVAAGEAAAEPTYFDGPAGGRGLCPAAPQSVSRRPIKRNEPILIDIGCCVDGYTIDQTRTAVIGELSPELIHAYDTAVAITRRSEKMLRPGSKPDELYMMALEMAAAAGLAEHFMGFGQDQVKFLGHGIGLEIDEWPVLARGFQEPLDAGMVIAIEPKFTFPGRGVVGIENTYLITDTGWQAVTRSPEELYVI